MRLYVFVTTPESSGRRQILKLFHMEQLKYTQMNLEKATLLHREYNGLWIIQVKDKEQFQKE
jgi:hypothetical protein